MPRLLSTYIFKEIFVPFILTLVILTITVLLSRTLELIDLIVGHGVGPGNILLLTFTMIPTFLTTITPIAFLIAILIGFSRLSSTSEIIAMKAGGVSLSTHLKPVMLFALVVFIILVAMTTHVTPWGNNHIKEIMYDVARTNTTAGIKEQTFYNRYKGIVLYVDRIPTEGSMMQGIFISERDPKNGETLIFAKRGRFIPSPEDLSVTLSLEDGSMQIPGNKDKATNNIGAPFDIVNFQRYSLSLLHKDNLTRKINEKPLRELYLFDLIGLINSGRAMEKGKRDSWQTTRYVIELHKRLALPAGVFVFALLAIPLGIRKARSAGVTNFSVAIVVILIYFTLSLSFESLAENATLPPVLAIWSTNIIFALFGAYLFYKSAKEMPIKSLILIDHTLIHIIRSLKKTACRR